jgi:hypothetical protein
VANFLEIFKKVPLIVALHLFFIAKWQIFATKKIRVSAAPFHTALTDVDCCRLKMLSGLFGEFATGLLLRIGGRQHEIMLKLNHFY